MVTAANCLAGVEQSTLGVVDILVNEYNTADNKRPLNIISNAECEYKNNVYKVRLLTPCCAQVYHRVER